MSTLQHDTIYEVLTKNRTFGSTLSPTIINSFIVVFAM